MNLNEKEVLGTILLWAFAFLVWSLLVLVVEGYSALTIAIIIFGFFCLLPFAVYTTKMVIDYPWPEMEYEIERKNRAKMRKKLKRAWRKFERVKKLCKKKCYSEHGKNLKDLKRLSVKCVNLKDGLDKIY